MLFPTVQFAIFFPIVLALSWALMSRPQVWKPFIIAASYVFYAAASWRFCLLLAGVTIGNQAAARLIDRTGDQRRRSVILGVAVALDLGVLAVFKYYGFFVQSVAHGLDAVRLGLPLPLLAIALPVGISFFTFQAISYVVDVKRGVVRPASLVDVAVYLSFFPHLVAGPIVRAREFLPQLAEPRDPRRVAGSSGLPPVAPGVGEEAGGGQLGARADRAGAGEEAGDRRHPRAQRGRPGVRGPRRLHGPGPVARRL